MFAVTDRIEPARGFRPQPLPTQAGRHGFHVELVTLVIRQAWRNHSVVFGAECSEDVITDKVDAGLSDDDADARRTLTDGGYRQRAKRPVKYPAEVGNMAVAGALTTLDADARWRSLSI